VAPGLVDRHDLRVSKPGQRLGFAEEARDGTRALQGAGVEDLQGDVALQVGVEGAVDRGEGPRAERDAELEPAQAGGHRGARRQGRGGIPRAPVVGRWGRARPGRSWTRPPSGRPRPRGSDPPGIEGRVDFGELGAAERTSKRAPESVVAEAGWPTT